MSKIDLKLILKQKCKTSRNIIIYYVLWMSATSKSTHFSSYGLLKVVLNSDPEWVPQKQTKTCRLLTIMDPKWDPKCCTLSPRNASWGHPEQPFRSPVTIYNHLAPTDHQKAVKINLKVSKINPQSDKFKPSRQSQPIPATPTNPRELNRISKKTHQTTRSNTL